MTPIVKAGSRWSVHAVQRVEDLADAVWRAGFDALQFTNGPFQGTLAFGVDDDVVYTCGRIGGHVALKGALSETMVTMGVAISAPSGTRQWSREIHSGTVGLFLPGDEKDAVYTPGFRYLVASLSAESLERKAAKLDLVLDARQLESTRLHRNLMASRLLAPMDQALTRVHAGKAGIRIAPEVFGRYTLDRLIRHFARQPHLTFGRETMTRHGRILEKARDYIHNHLETPLSIDAIACAACTSQRTLYRAFADLLDETPQSYVRKLRLHRVRQKLASQAEQLCTITMLANDWGISELGRFSGAYRELFGELPSETRRLFRDGSDHARPALLLARSA